MEAKVAKVTGGPSIGKVLEVYAELRRKIFSGYYLPRQHLVESEISEALGVKRATVREALRRLASEGLVEVRPYRGCLVTDVSIQDAFETYQIEAALEGFAAYLATDLISGKDLEMLEALIRESTALDPNKVEEWERYNRQIHKIIIKASENERLIKLIKNNVKFSNYWFIVLSTPGQIPKKNQEHSLILQSMKKGDALKSREILEKHILDAAEDIRERLQKMLLFPKA
jgi:DNA-binding GntR family transcriptional regulator